MTFLKKNKTNMRVRRIAMSRLAQKGFFVFFALVVLIGLGACERPKSEVVKPTPTPETGTGTQGEVTVAESPTSEIPTATPTSELSLTLPTPAPETPVPEATTVSVAPTPTPTLEASVVVTGTAGVETSGSATAGQQRVHVVQPGEWVYAIARRYGISPETIIRANNLRPPDYIIYPGQTLIIPSDGGEPPAGRLEHVVQAGETLYSIAQKYGTTVEAIKNLNGLTSDTIYVGQILVIP